MITWDTDNPEKVDPLGNVIGAWLVIVLLTAAGSISGYWIGKDRAWSEIQDAAGIEAEVRAELDRAVEFSRTVEPHLWVLGCAPSPVADIESIDHTRRFVTLACNPLAEVPE